MARLLAAIVAFAAIAVQVSAQDAAPARGGWPVTEGAAGGGRYSPLAEIHRGNVSRLAPVWSYRHGDVYDGGFLPDKVNRGTAFEGTPILQGRRLILTTPMNRVIALDAETGRELWTYDPEIDSDRRFANMIINRGAAAWESASAGADAACESRLFFATLDARLIALDSATGLPCADFGDGGQVDLTATLGGPLADEWEYNVTSPPTVVGDRVIVGSSIADTVRRRQPPGDVRAFDARTGALAWRFRTIPVPGTPGSETWENDSQIESGGANVWSTITADLERGLVFLPTSTASPDYFGGDRPGANLFSDSVVALRAETGERVWHFQTVHHDLWDYDLAAPPVLVQVRRGDDLVDAVAQAAKTGFVFVLDRTTGEPLFPVEERPVPQSDVPGERSWPTQPFPTKPPPLVPQTLSEADLWDLNPKHLAKCREMLAGLRNEGLFTPPTLKGSVEYPFSAGGANWSGAGYDPVARRLFVPVNNRVHVIRLKRLPDSNFDSDHRVMRTTLRGIHFILSGKGSGLRYWLSPIRGRTPLAVDGVPCNRPPWGTLVAVDLDAGEIAWTVPTGEHDGVKGLMNFGPPLVTAGGLVFHAGTVDLHLRAHDAATGEVLARFPLPAGLHAGPITYKLRPDSPQMLVIAPGGHVGVGSKLGDYVIAYALSPEVAAESRPDRSEPAP